MRTISPGRDSKQQKKDLTLSAAPRYDDPLSRYRLSYLNGGGASARPRERSSSCARGIPSSSLRPIAWRKKCGPGASRPRLSQLCPLEWQENGRPKGWGRFVPRVIIWDEVYTVPRPTLEIFLDWLEGRGVQVICCGDHGQPPPIAGEMPHEWLRDTADYYEEVEVDHRAKDPLFKDLKKQICLQPDKVQCQEIRKALPGCLGWERFVEAWRPCDLILTPRLKVRDRAQKLLFERHGKYFPDTSVPLLYRPKDTRRQNIMVTIPGPLLGHICLDVLDGKWGSDWALGYALTVHSSQGLTISDPQKSLDHKRLPPVV